MSGRGFVEARAGLTLEHAARELQRVFDGDVDGLLGVVARYDGSCTLVRFAETVEHAPDASRGTQSWSGAGPGDDGRVGEGTEPLLAAPRWDLDRAAFLAGVEETRERIAAGDVYVMNLTARVSGTLATSGPEQAFHRLQARAGSAMSALVTGLPGATPWLASVSPERFVRIRRHRDDSRWIEVCPIKGTRPRGADPVADRAAAAELLGDAKERAEHVMVVDLERNDIGAACVPGTVSVDPLYEVVPTPYCHQLESTVRGALRAETTFADVMAHAFPCGSVTGAPKRAAMRIIDELEASSRGAYCGALLVAVAGELDSSVLIRTLEGVRGGDGDAVAQAAWGTGCGITYDSVASAEYEELLLKASPVLGVGLGRL